MSAETRISNIMGDISRVSHTLKWKDIENLCRYHNFNVSPSKKGYKVNIGSSVWCVHLEHRHSDELKHGIIRELKKILVKENIL